ncbi:neuralized E3 ubiquitin protein ligase 1Ab [Chanos chanos]|uniref:E3 ubiquitin-protein ligase NEURL1 n=1 Tax=Chanos chanos TaxID=29144 RepID=A0A6J2WFZ3_CHACN|nr:E3 ubiquitin-protein ligase NEURL1-like [Chanos chanos]
MGGQITRNTLYDLGGPFPTSSQCCPPKAARCVVLQQQCSGLAAFPLLFHPSTKGSQIVMDRNQRSVRRQASFCNAITFSNRPVALYEQVRLKVTKKQCCWSGALRVGFTTKDPSRMSPDLLPKYACPDLVSQSGFWAKALPEEISNEGSVIAFWLDKKGRVFYRVNESSPLLFFSGVPTAEPVWALIDVYGLTRGVQLLDSEMVPADCSRPRSLRHNMDDWRLSVSLCELRLRDEQLSSSSYTIPQNSLNSHHSSVLPTHLHCDLHFHHVHGNSIYLLNEHTACRHSNRPEDCTLAFTQRPLRYGECVFIKIIMRAPTPIRHTSLTYGVTSCNPSHLHSSDLPVNPNDLLDRREFWAVSRVSTPLQGGDILGFRVTAEGDVLLSHNGSSATRQLCVDNSRPLWIFFNSDPAIAQLVILGTTHSYPANLPDSPSLPSCRTSWVDECTICCENEVDTVLYACGHMCLCYACGLRLKRMTNACCPICRRAIKDIIKTYRST